MAFDGTITGSPTFTAAKFGNGMNGSTLIATQVTTYSSSTMATPVSRTVTTFANLP
ncbi:MAG: hypothetical protein ABJA67_13515 [Chthonomonadales bacterium]